MKKSRFTEEQMVAMLREVDRTSVAEVSKKHKVSDPHSSLKYQTPAEFKLRYDSTNLGAISRSRARSAPPPRA